MPIVVVTPGGEGATGPIIVGVDGSDAAGAALDWALAHAADAGLSVHAARVFDRLALGTELAFARVELDDLRPAMHAELDAVVDRHGPADVRTEVLDGGARGRPGEPIPDGLDARARPTANPHRRDHRVGRASVRRPRDRPDGARRGLTVGLARHARVVQDAQVDVDQLIENACTTTGLSDFGDPGFRDGLEVLVDGLDNEAQLTEIGQLVAEGAVAGALANRLRVTAWHRDHPELADQPVTAPVFIVGVSRSGTTALSHLLARDPANRSLLGWEASEPVPPPRADTYRTDPRFLAAIEAEENNPIHQLNPDFKAMHHDPADMPVECLTVMAHDFVSLQFNAMFNLKSYAEWILERGPRTDVPVPPAGAAAAPVRCRRPVAAQVPPSRPGGRRDRRRLPRRPLHLDPPRPRDVHRVDRQHHPIAERDLQRRRVVAVRGAPLVADARRDADPHPAIPRAARRRSLRRRVVPRARRRSPRRRSPPLRRPRRGT